MLKKIILSSLLSIALFNQAFAEDIAIVGTVTVKKPIKNNKIQTLAWEAPNNEQISLLKIDLSNNAKASFLKRINYAMKQPNTFKTSSLPAAKQLGMNGVPVLNQGNHGSCVVFSITGAIDAVLAKGDYVSQICQLVLGRHIENNGYTPSGWNGSWSRTVLGQMDSFGFVSKDSQRASGCGGLTEYPMCGLELLNEESVTDFHAHSEKLTDNRIAWSTILDVYQASFDNINEDNILLETKKSLVAGDRVILGILLLDFENGTVGAQGTYKRKNDTWLLTQEMLDSLNNQPEYAGHAIIITGFDDDAEVKDEQGNIQRGIFTLRNSWGANVGNQGDFYMTYSYFKALAIESQRIRNF